MFILVKIQSDANFFWFCTALLLNSKHDCTSFVLMSTYRKTTDTQFSGLELALPNHGIRQDFCIFHSKVQIHHMY